jgi:ribonuclease BN (tRNA processing enzyme)
MEEYDPASLLQVGDLSIQFALVKHYIPSFKHYIPSFAMVISSNQKIVYSADSGPCDELATLAISADLFLCEATRCERDDVEWGHLSACEAATLAKRAKVKQLILTHFWPDCDYSQNLEQARAIFGEELEVATELRTYNVTDAEYHI